MSPRANQLVAARSTWAQARAWRMNQQHLLRRADVRDLAEVISRLCGVHAQLMTSAELSLWARIDGFDRTCLPEALWEQRTLVKLWAMRGTLHLLVSSELGLYLSAMSAYGHYGLRNPTIIELANAIGEALTGKLLTREELAIEVGRRTGSSELAGFLRESWGSYLKPPSLRGMLCFGPSAGGRVRFTSPRDWIPGGVSLIDVDLALGEVGRRYLRAFGPATVADLARWWEGAPSTPQRMLRAMGDDVVAVDLAGEPAFLLAEDLEAFNEIEPVRVVRLLPAFDPWVVTSSRTSAALLDQRFRERVYRGQGWFSQVLLVSGEMRGVWTVKPVGKRRVVTLEPFAPLPSWARRGAEAEVERLSRFLGKTLDIVWTEP